MAEPEVTSLNTQEESDSLEDLTVYEVVTEYQGAPPTSTTSYPHIGGKWENHYQPVPICSYRRVRRTTWKWNNFNLSIQTSPRPEWNSPHGSRATFTGECGVHLVSTISINLIFKSISFFNQFRQIRQYTGPTYSFFLSINPGSPSWGIVREALQWHHKWQTNTVKQDLTRLRVLLNYYLVLYFRKGAQYPKVTNK